MTGTDYSGHERVKMPLPSSSLHCHTWEPFHTSQTTDVVGFKSCRQNEWGLFSDSLYSENKWYIDPTLFYHVKRTCKFFALNETNRIFNSPAVCNPQNVPAIKINFVPLIPIKATVCLVYKPIEWGLSY